MNQKKAINQRLTSIIKNEFDSCEWFIISSNELMKTLNNFIELVKDGNKSFEEIKDYIGTIGMGIGNVEKCLDGVEECYNSLVEELNNENKENNEI